jgi:protein subunit release factor A
MAVIIEIRAAEGGLDSKLLVEEQVGIYARLSTRHRL